MQTNKRFKWSVLAVVACAWLTGVAAWAGTPRKMAYQLMALDPASGKVLADRDISVRMELRQGAADGSAVWSQDFAARTDEAGMCQLMLEWADSIDWSAGDYFLVTMVDGQACGAAQLTSVPYALQTAAVEGVITPQELASCAWRTTDNNGYYTYVYRFQADGTGTLQADASEEGMGYSRTFRWQLDAVGHLCLYELMETNSAGSVALGAYTFTVQKLSDTSIAFDNRAWTPLQTR